MGTTAYPDGLLIGIVVMALLILAYLMRDRVRNGGGDNGGTVPEPDPTPSRDPRVVVSHGGSETVGEPFWVRGSFDLDQEAELEEMEIEINGENIGDRWSLVQELPDERLEPADRNFDFVSERREVQPREYNTYSVEVVDSNGNRGSGDGRFSPTGPGEEGPRVRIVREEIDEEARGVDLAAVAEPGDFDISQVFIGLLNSRGERMGESNRNGTRAEFLETGLNPGGYRVVAEAVDENGNDDITHGAEFQFEPEGIGPEVPRGPGGAPIIVYNAQALERRAENLPNELVEAVEVLAEAIRENSGSQEVEVELGQELDALVAAIESISDESDVDISNIVEELRNIRQEVENGSTDLSTLEGQIEELIEAVHEQSGLSDEEREFYMRIERKIDELIDEAGFDPALEDLENLVNVTANPEHSVEVQGLNEEDRALLRRILDEMAERGMTDDELEWFVMEFMEQRRRQNRIFEALQFIWMELRGGEDPEGGPGPEGGPRGGDDGEGDKNDEGDNSGMSDFTQELRQVEGQLKDDTQEEIEELETLVEEIRQIEEEGRISLELETQVGQEGQKLVALLRDALQHEQVVEKLIERFDSVQHDVTQEQMVQWMQSYAKHENKIRKDLGDANDILRQIHDQIIQLKEELEEQESIEDKLENLSDSLNTHYQNMAEFDQKLETLGEDILANYRKNREMDIDIDYEDMFGGNDYEPSGV